MEDDIWGIGKKFRIEFLSSGTYINNMKKLDDAEIESSIITGRLIKHPSTNMEHLYIVDETNCMNIIPVSRVVSMIHI